MSRQRMLWLALPFLGLASPPKTQAQVAAPSPQAKTARPSEAESSLIRALGANPVTAPYRFATELRGKQVALKGRVGTKQVHDLAIQTAIGLGVAVVDDLVIDTAAAHQVAAYPNPGSYAGPSFGPYFPGAGYYGSVPYIYPQPLFGKLDEPFYEFEPPAISYPPWWAALTAQRLGPPTVPQAARPNNAPPAGDPAVGSTPPPQGEAPPPGTIDMAIDAQGVATLRGSVPSLAERIALGQRIAQTSGVTEVVNLLNVQPNAPAGPSDDPPPPPVPAEAPKRMIRLPAEATPINVDADPIGRRAARSVNSRSGLANLPIRVKVRDGLASVSGKVPTVYEAMLAYRAVQQTPGVREVDDRLEFAVPAESEPNPLVEKGRPEDVEPYLEAQVRRQVGDIAHVDRVRVQGNALDLRGTLGREADRGRFDAILRSMAILRGFRLSAEVQAESR